MKHQVPECMKFKKLQRRLGVSRVIVAGTLELLWVTTQKNTPKGDIGKFTNEEIAIECDWEGDPEMLVESLIESGWIDRCETHRLVIHDWEQHAPGWIRRQLARHKQSFVTPSNLPPVTDDRLEPTRNPTQPNPTKPNERTLASVRPIDEEEFDLLRPRCVELKDAVDANPRRELKSEDRELCVKAVVMEHHGIVDLSPLMLSVKRKKLETGTRWGYFRGALRNALEGSGHDFHEVYKSTAIPPPPEPVGASP